MEEFEITKDMTISSVLKLDESMSDVFVGFGMFCIFCHLSEDETIEEACDVHGIEVDFLVQKLNQQYQKIAKKKSKSTRTKKQS